MWKPIPGFGRMRSSAQPLAPQHVSRGLEVQVRVHPEYSRHPRAVLELCHGDPWLSAPLRRRGASCDLHTLLVPKWTSAVLNLISLRRIWYMSNPVLTIGALSRLLLSCGSCLLVRDTTSFSL